MNKREAHELRDQLCIEDKCSFDKGCSCLEAINAALAAARKEAAEECAKIQPIMPPDTEPCAEWQSGFIDGYMSMQDAIRSHFGVAALAPKQIIPSEAVHRAAIAEMERNEALRRIDQLEAALKRSRYWIASHKTNGSLSRGWHEEIDREVAAIDAALAEKPIGYSGHSGEGEDAPK